MSLSQALNQFAQNLGRYRWDRHTKCNIPAMAYNISLTVAPHHQVTNP